MGGRVIKNLEAHAFTYEESQPWPVTKPEGEDNLGNLRTNAECTLMLKTVLLKYFVGSDPLRKNKKKPPREGKKQTATVTTTLGCPAAE